MAKKPSGYNCFSSLVNAIRRLDVTPSEWDEIGNPNEREALSSLIADLSNNVGELENINPKRWKRKQ